MKVIMLLSAQLALRFKFILAFWMAKQHIRIQSIRDDCEWFVLE